MRNHLEPQMEEIDELVRLHSDEKGTMCRLTR